MHPHPPHAPNRLFAHATHTHVCGARGPRSPARRQVDYHGWVLTRGAGGGEEARLVDLGERLGPDGATRLAALLLAAPPVGLTALDLRCTSRPGLR